MIRLRYLGLAMLSAFATTVDAHADNFAKLRETPNYQHAVYADAQQTGAWLNDSCAGAKAQIGASVGVMETPNVDDKGVPQSGRWIEHVSVDGCRTHRQLNVLVMVAPPQSLAMIPMLPGTTHADPTLEKDGARYAFAAAAIDPKGCTPIFIEIRASPRLSMSRRRSAASPAGRRFGPSRNARIAWTSRCASPQPPPVR